MPNTILLLNYQSSVSKIDLRKQGLGVIIQIEALRDESQDGHFHVNGMMENEKKWLGLTCNQLNGLH